MLLELFLLFSATFIESLSAQDVYSNKYNIDLDSLINNDRLLKNYVDCVLDKGPCTPEGRDLKRILPEALQDGCTKCTEEHKGGIKKVIKHLTQNKKDWWQELVVKYDPEGKFKVKYAELATKEGIKF